MGQRANYIDQLLATGKITDPLAGSNIRAFAEFLDDYQQGFADVSIVVNFVNSVYSAGVFKDHDAYLNVYNMMLGLPYNPLPDNLGQAFITNEDYRFGLVDIRVYDAVYQGPFDDISLAANGPPGAADLLRQAIRTSLGTRDATLLSIDVVETTTKRLWNLPIYANYKVRIFYHGSPFNALTVAGVLIGLIGLVFFTVLVWRVGSAYDAKQRTKQIDLTTLAVNTLAAIAADKNNPPDLRLAATNGTASALPEVMKALKIPEPKSTIEAWKNLLLVGVIGVGVLMVLPPVIGMLSKPRSRAIEKA